MIMTNLEKMLLNNADELADKLTVPYYHVDGFIMGYTGPHRILYSIASEEVWWMRDEMRFFPEKGIDSFIYDPIWKDFNGTRNACKEGIKEWLKAEYKEESNS